jgi:hypothetical protein
MAKAAAWLEKKYRDSGFQPMFLAIHPAPLPWPFFKGLHDYGYLTINGIVYNLPKSEKEHSFFSQDFGLKEQAFNIYKIVICPAWPDRPFQANQMNQANQAPTGYRIFQSHKYGALFNPSNPFPLPPDPPTH